MQVPIATRRFVFIPMDLQDLSVGLLQVPNKQWGYQTVHGTNPVTYDLPIPFEEAPFTVAISTGNSGNHASCGGFTKTTIVLRAGTTAGVWDTVGFFIIGCQLQWGINTGGAVRTSTLPIPFTNVFLAVASTSSEWCCPGCSATNTTVTTRAYQSNRPDVAQPNDVNWIIIGCQPQWGFTVFDPVDYKNVNFTLPLSVNGTFCAFSTGYDPKGSTFLWHSMSHFNNVNVGVTGFVFDSRYTFTGLGYLAVCWQKQWGTNTIGSRTTRTEAYPLPYSEFCLPIVSGKGYVGGLNYGFGVGVTNFGLTSVTIANNSEDSSYRWTGYTYIVVGAQPQWGYSTGGSGAWALKFNGVYTAVVVGAPGFPAREFCGFTFDYTLTGWSFTAGYNSPVSYIRPTTTAISLGY